MFDNIHPPLYCLNHTPIHGYCARKALVPRPSAPCTDEGQAFHPASLELQPDSLICIISEGIRMRDVKVLVGTLPDDYRPGDVPSSRLTKARRRDRSVRIRNFGWLTVDRPEMPRTALADIRQA